MTPGGPKPPELPRIQTGIPGLDHVSVGGFPRGRVVVVAGPAGSAKTVLAGQFLASGAAAGEPGVFVTLEEEAADLRRNLSTLGFDIAGWEESGDWAFVDGSPRYDSHLDEVTPLHVDTLLAQIGQAIDRVGATRVVIDSFGGAGFDRGDTLSRLRLRGLLFELRRMGVTVLMTVETVRDDEGSYGIEQYVADTVVLLRNSLDGESRRRTVEVLKMRGAEHRRGQFAFTVLPGRGMVVLPLDTEELDHASTDIRVTTGNAELDELCGGGLFHNSITLVSGATGTGKTLVATEFLVGGIERGEKSLLLAFEESRDQLDRNARGWGQDFTAAESAGLLKIVAVYPELATLEDHLVRIKTVIEEFGPSRIAVDSMTALERVGSQKAFREFVIALISHIKAQQVVGLFTASTESLLGGAVGTEAPIASLTDAIVLLRYIEVHGEVQRALTVLKMRGSDHDRDIREYRIDGAGMHVGEPIRTVAGILSGNVVDLTPNGESADRDFPPSAG